ncbi:MAG: HAMP domain-containing protein [Gammaproteobacteria bacterium]|nr:HAMP domain-containing protein [Gammaproteobacteria bacterium]
MIGIEFYFEMSKPDLEATICGNTYSYQQEPALLNEQSNTSLSNLRNKILIMFVVLTIVVAIVMTMFIKNITTPLQKMSDAAKLINNGDLSQVIDVETRDEIGQLAAALNELTSNLQECSTFTSSTATRAIEQLKQIQSNLNHNSDLYIQIDDLKSIIESLIEFTSSFTILGTDINK